MEDKFLEEINKISYSLESLPKVWNGKRAIMEMKEADYSQWKQMEWIGFYFGFLCNNKLKNVLNMPGPKYGHTAFDGLGDYPWDFKAHATNTSSHQIIVNDKEAILGALKDYGFVGLILAMGDVEYNDEKRTFQKWHEKLKGGLSKYSLERIKRGAWSRLRKVEFKLVQIDFICVTCSLLEKVGSFQINFRNADGSPRREKVLLDLEKLDKEKEVVASIEFDK